MRLIKAVVLFSSFFFFIGGVLIHSKEKPKEKVYIPPQVKKVMEETVIKGVKRQDVPFKILKTVYLPAQNKNFLVIFFEAKNKELMSLAPQTGKKEKESKNNLNRSKFNIFFWFYRREGDSLVPFYEQYVPTEIDWGANSNPEATSTYIVCTILSKGNYLLSMAITSLDLKRIGIVNHFFTLPGPEDFKEKLALTPIIFVKSLQELQTPEIPPVVHKDYFIYSTLQVEPKIENIFSVGETPDILYFIHGCSPDPNDPRKFDIEITYNVKKEDKDVIKFNPQNFQIPFISHQIPLKDEKNKDLEAGKYKLEIKVKDKISGKELIEYVDFEIK